MPKKYLKDKWLIAAFSFLLLQIFSSLINEFNVDSLVRSISFAKFIFLALGMNILFNYNHKNFLIFLRILFFVVVFVMFDASVQYFFGENIFGNPYRSERLSSIFGDEYIVGSFLCKMGFLISLIFLFKLKNFKYKNILLFLFLMTLLLIILITGDRMPSLLFLMGITVFYLFKGLKDYKNFLLIFLIYIICIVMFFSNPIVSKRFKEISHERYGLSKNFDIKNSQWGAHFLTAWEIFKDNPIVGVGSKNFRIESCLAKYEDIESSSAKKRCTTHPHNIILEILSEHGVLGMVLFLILIYFILKGIKLNYEHNIFFLVSLLICIWPIGTSGSIFTTVNGTFLWLNIGVLLYSKNKDFFINNKL
ncbi:O-antigen ligase family protein [Candidatus Pelagibacter sp.]|nr:O-antigen ligase family protein [Candidatus Pelagibacter sp.]